MKLFEDINKRSTQKTIIAILAFLIIAVPVATILVTQSPRLPEIFEAYPPPPPPPSPPPPPPSYTAVACWDAKDGTITEPFKVDSDGHIWQTVKTNDNPSKGGKATYTFDLSQAGDYIATASAHAPDDGSNSFFVNIDTEPSTKNVWALKPNGSKFTDQTVSWGNDYKKPRKVFSLTSGSHTLIFRGREPNTELARVCINLLTSAPPSEPPPSPPLPPPGGSINIQVDLQGLPEDSFYKKAAVVYTDTGWNGSVMLDANGQGQLDLAGLDTSGSHHFMIYIHPYLRKATEMIDMSASPEVINFGELRIGDLNTDNQINSLDWSLMNTNYGQDGDPAFD